MIKCCISIAQDITELKIEFKDSCRNVGKGWRPSFEKVVINPWSGNKYRKNLDYRIDLSSSYDLS